jgi:hypothetical protein
MVLLTVILATINKVGWIDVAEVSANMPSTSVSALDVSRVI